MPMNKTPKLREPRGPIVQKVRDTFLEREFKERPDEFYLEDIRLIENMDFLLQRCVIMQRKNVEASVKMVSQILKWRKEKKLYEMKNSSFPRELTICGGLFIYENDKFGNKTLYLRASIYKNCAELKTATKDYLKHLMFQIDDPKDGATFAVIMDLTKTTWTNYDLDFMMHLVTLLKDYFPVNLDYVLAINFHWVFSAGWALIKRLIPAERRDVVQFINSDKVFEFIPEENCPDFLGGTCKQPYQFIHEDSPSAVDYLIQNSTKSIPKKRLSDIIDQFSDVIPEELSQQLKHQVNQLKNGIIVDESLGNNSNNNKNNEDLIKAPLVQRDAQECDTKAQQEAK